MNRGRTGMEIDCTFAIPVKIGVKNARFDYLP